MKGNDDWPKGLSKPALRALTGAGVERLDQLADWQAGDILKLHGMGRKGIDTLEQALAERGLSFKKAEA